MSPPRLRRRSCRPVRTPADPSRDVGPSWEGCSVRAMAAVDPRSTRRAPARLRPRPRSPRAPAGGGWRAPSRYPRATIAMKMWTSSSLQANGPLPEPLRLQATIDRLAREPILPVGDVPELAGVLGREVGTILRLGREEPGALDLAPPGTQRLEPVGHDVVGVQAEQQVGEEPEVVDLPPLRGVEAADRHTSRLPGHATSSRRSPSGPWMPPTQRPSCAKFSPESGGVTAQSAGWIDGQW